MRLIDADALEKRFQALLAHIYEKGDNDAALLTVIQMVKSAPTVGNWISVKDNLPKKDGLYLCLTIFDNIKLYYQINLWMEKHWFWGHDVRYWMPLPELPEEVKND